MLETLDVKRQSIVSIGIFSQPVGFVVDAPGHDGCREVKHQLKDIACHSMLLF